MVSITAKMVSKQIKASFQVDRGLISQKIMSFSSSLDRTSMKYMLIVARPPPIPEVQSARTTNIRKEVTIRSTSREIRKERISITMILHHYMRIMDLGLAPTATTEVAQVETSIVQEDQEKLTQDLTVTTVDSPMTNGCRQSSMRWRRQTKTQIENLQFLMATLSTWQKRRLVLGFFKSNYKSQSNPW